MSTESGSDRLRTHPQERFSPSHQKIDLNQATAELRGESRPSPGGHRQKTLYKHGGATIALFHFDAGGRMADHRTAGTVSIHALEGRLQIKTSEETHDLTAGQIVVLAP